MTKGAGEICEMLGLKALVLQPRYNIAPTQQAPVILSQGFPELKSLRWGLIPFWAREPFDRPPLINAKAETLEEKPAFRRAFERRRCLVLADGYYEWKKSVNGKIPYRYILSDSTPFAFAGLWDEWRELEGTLVTSFTIVTTSANDLCRQVHERMPVILPKAQYAVWLDPTNSDTASLKKLLTAYPASAMKCYAVSTRVNSVANDDEACIRGIEELF